VRIIGQAAKLSRTPASMAAATPELGEHTEEILLELDYQKKEIAQMRERGVV